MAIPKLCSMDLWGSEVPLTNSWKGRLLMFSGLKVLFYQNINWMLMLSKSHQLTSITKEET
jgi:hypothetical protein